MLSDKSKKRFLTNLFFKKTLISQHYDAVHKRCASIPYQLAVSLCKTSIPLRNKKGL